MGADISNVIEKGAKIRMARECTNSAYIIEKVVQTAFEQSGRVCSDVSSV